MAYYTRVCQHNLRLTIILHLLLHFFLFFCQKLGHCHNKPPCNLLNYVCMYVYIYNNNNKKDFVSYTFSFSSTSSSSSLYFSTIYFFATQHNELICLPIQFIHSFTNRVFGNNDGHYLLIAGEIKIISRKIFGVKSYAFILWIWD